jgi:hypothetical protein
LLLLRMPGGTGAYAGRPQPYRVELLLCGHHFRLSQWTLAAAGGVAQVLPGRGTADVFGMAQL